MELLKSLSEAPGAPGREERVRALIEEQVAELVDDMHTDALGNLICIKRGSASKPKKVMLACHMDEIAFYVRNVSEKGFVRIQKLGGFDTRNLFARTVRIQTRKHGDIFGVLNPAGRPIHIASEEDRKKIPEIKDFFIDLGRDAEEVLEMVTPGDPVTLVQEFSQIGELVTGKCLDNRVACWAGIRILQQVQKPKDDLFVVFTVQEEIGIRGATTSAYAIEPDIGIAIDTTLAVDTPGVTDEEQITKLGEGVAIKIMDSYAVSDRGLVDEFLALAEKHEIPHQFEILPLGGTDAAALQRARGGARAITLSVPTRYIHTVTECVHRKDLEATVALLVQYLQG